jgi:phosphoglycolate phosphatase
MMKLLVFSKILSYNSEMSKLRLLIFDLDGTLIDSADDYQVSVNRLMREENKPELSREQVQHGLGHGLRSMVRGLFPDLANEIHRLHEIEERFLYYYLQYDCTTKTALYPGALEFLRSWKGELAVVTNKSLAPTKKIMTHLGLDEFHWSSVFCFESLPERKPSAFPLEEAMKRIGAAREETLMIGDGLPDLKAAQNAGVRSVIATFGYTDAALLKEHHPTRFFSSYQELQQLIRELQ